VAGGPFRVPLAGLHGLVGHRVPLGGPTLFGGPLVMSSPEQLADAGRRYRAGEMGRLDPSVPVRRS